METRKHLPADERRALTVGAVIELAGMRNPSDITTAAIASHMRLTQGALFRHFPNKEAILQAAMDWVAEQLLPRLDRAAAGEASPLAALQAMFMSHVAFVVEHPGVPRMLFSELQHAEPTPARRVAETLMQRYAERVRAQIDAGKACGEIAADVDPQAAAALFIGSVQGLVMQSMLSGRLQRVRSGAPGMFALIRRGIAA